MKKIIFIALCLVSSSIFSQSKFILGPSYTFGASSIYGNKMSPMDMSSPIKTEYTLKLNTGAGFCAEYFFNQKIGITLKSGYMQRGSIFNKDAANYSPRYRFNYIDAVLGVGYRTKELCKNFQAIANLGFSQHTLLNASRVNSYNAVNITNDIKMIDYGISLGIGGNTLFANAGLSNVFTGTYEINGISGKNILYGLQMSYLLGKKGVDETTKIKN
jgi:hypothetical protein